MQTQTKSHRIWVSVTCIAHESLESPEVKSTQESTSGDSSSRRTRQRPPATCRPLMAKSCSSHKFYSSQQGIREACAFVSDSAGVSCPAPSIQAEFSVPPSMAFTSSATETQVRLLWNARVPRGILHPTRFLHELT